MGIIREILSEAIKKDNNWAELIGKIDEILPDILIPHKIIGNVIQYDNNYKKVSNGFKGIYKRGSQEIIQAIYKNRDVLGMTKIWPIVFDRLFLYKNEITGHSALWFDMTQNLHTNIIGIGAYKYVQPTRDDNTVRKVRYGEDRENIPSDAMVELSKLYPDLFVKTIKTKTGYIQDKVEVLPDNIGRAAFYELLYSKGLSDEEIALGEKYLKDIDRIRPHVIDALKSIGLGNRYDGDLNVYNVGYDKDGKLKVIDI